MKTYRKNAIVIGVLFVLTMLAGMVDAYLVIPELSKPLSYLISIRGKVLIGGFMVTLMSIGIVWIALAFYPVVKKQSETLALAYVAFRVLECLLLLIGPLCYIVLLILGDKNIAIESFSSSQMELMKELLIAIKYNAYQIAMVVLGFGSLFLCYSLFKSRAIPQWLSVWGFVGYFCLMLSALLDIAGLIDTANGLGSLLYVPGGIWELAVLPVWLFVKGFSFDKPVRFKYE